MGTLGSLPNDYNENSSLKQEDILYKIFQQLNDEVQPVFSSAQ